jgi:hypothetical protein
MSPLPWYAWALLAVTALLLGYLVVEWVRWVKRYEEEKHWEWTVNYGWDCRKCDTKRNRGDRVRCRSCREFKEKGQ